MAIVNIDQNKIEELMTLKGRVLALRSYLEEARYTDDGVIMAIMGFAEKEKEIKIPEVFTEVFPEATNEEAEHADAED